ncbi:MAG: hypothetical protein GF347_01855 [Candidatus Moranbacteria bacterium]|nr:hypothetical protein [Candidatus Moranbacteria bacterium]
MATPKLKKAQNTIFDQDKLSRALREIQASSEEEKASLLAKRLGFPYVDLNIYPLSLDVLHTLDEEFAQKSGIITLHKAGKNLKIAIAQPENLETVEAITELQDKGYRCQIYIASKNGINHALQKYKQFNLAENLDDMKVNLSGKELEEFEEQVKELVDLKKKITSIPTTEILNIIIAGAIKMNASDIHFEPQKENVKLRYRLDGMLQNITEIPYNNYSFVLNRIKMLGGMKLNIKDKAQDGRFEIKMNNPEREIDVRLSILPGNYGENIVARILSQDMSKLKLESLGLGGRPLEQLSHQITKPHGMILNTGPTGSGKTTTLYACLRKVNNPTNKIITIEDPIEYRLEGISQTQVEKERGYDFANGLRAIVRQDPDVVLVGEIRDEETADIATHASLTGHLVFSTIHANSSSEAIPRFIDMGIRPSLVSSAVNAIIAQRLVRKLCPHCSEEYQPATETLETINKFLSIISPKSNLEIPRDVKVLHRAKGCPKCNGLGYKGRVGIFEILEINNEIEKLINDMATDSEITTAALESGAVTMLQDGILKAVKGETSMEEVQRVTGTGDFLEEIYEKIMSQVLSSQLIITKRQIKEILEIGYDRKKLENMFENASNKESLEYVVAGGLHFEAGDIHFEPEGDKVNIRYRIDGILQNIASLKSSAYVQILARIKTLSGFKAGSHEAVRDSRFGIKLETALPESENTQIDVRVSIITGGYGETVVMRLLNKSAKSLNVAKLGIREQTLSRLLNEIKKPNGIIINTGPTGSGKTTTLYSLLNRLNRPEIKIITVEDPIEYRMKGVIQTQIKADEGYDFSSALRALMRQNPDILMIGEIRDEETAKIAVQASLTGHLVFTTLHANDAVASIQRLINMNIDPSDIASATNCMMAQRIIRKLCDKCKKAVKPSPETEQKMLKVLNSISANSGLVPPTKIETIYEPQGCDECKGTGFNGVLPVAEVMTMSEKLEELITGYSNTTALTKQAINDGMITMSQDGVMKIVEGVTTFSEIERVTEY